MTVLVVSVILIWFLTMGLLLTPAETFTKAWQRLTKAKFRDDRVELQIMLDHMRTNPQDWNISRDTASYPRDSKAKKYFLSHDPRRGWEYTLTSFENSPRQMDAHFASQFHKEVQRQSSLIERKAMLRDFYPDLDPSTLLLK